MAPEVGGKAFEKGSHVSTVEIFPMIVSVFSASIIVTPILVLGRLLGVNHRYFHNSARKLSTVQNRTIKAGKVPKYSRQHSLFLNFEGKQCNFSLRTNTSIMRQG